MKKILLNGVGKHFATANLPLLIHAKDSTGGSLFSISVVADLYRQGAKILFLCGYHMARDEFITQTDATDTIFITSADEIILAKDKRVIFVSKETPELAIELANSLPDISKRVIFYKNFDLFNESVFESIADKPHLVLMGDIDQCTYKNALLARRWLTRIYFSSSAAPMDFLLPELPKYSGYLRAEGLNGVVSLA